MLTRIRAVALAVLTLTLTPAFAQPSQAPRFANEDPNDDDIVAPPTPRANCEAELAAAQLKFRATPLGIKKHGKLVCGSEDTVLYLGGPEKIRYNPTPLVTCSMALALARYESILQQEAERVFGAHVTRIGHLGTYNCRKMAAFDMVSEHAYANGIDLATFTLSNGKQISVLKHFQATAAAPTSKPAEFLRVTSQRGFDEGVFSSVITEYFDKLHKNHIHVDLARYRADGSR